MKLKGILAVILFPLFLNAKSVADFSYAFGTDIFDKYSLSYFTGMSTYVFAGANFSFYDRKDIDGVSSLRLPFNYVKKNYILSIKPFYYPKKDGFKTLGFKTSFAVVKGKDDIFTTYYLSAGFSKEDCNLQKSKDFIIDASLEKNFYDEFFIMAKAAVNINYDKRKFGYFDNSDLINYGHTGVVNFTVYSNIGMNFARSFKPDFNSYLYLGFDRLNGYLDDLNSYVVGLKTFIDEKENYYMDFNYNFADFKKFSNSRIFKISIGVNF